MSRRCREVVIVTHPAFEQLSETYKYFREYSSFLYTGDHTTCDTANKYCNSKTELLFHLVSVNDIDLPILKLAYLTNPHLRTDI